MVGAEVVAHDAYATVPFLLADLAPDDFEWGIAAGKAVAQLVQIAKFALACLGESNRVSLRRRTLPPPRSPPPRDRGAVPEVGRGGQVEEDSGAGGGLAEGLER